MPFPMEQQEEPDWCWNAVSVSLEHYFNPNSHLTQPDFAAQALNVPPAEAHGPRADVPFFLQNALTDLNLLAGLQPRSLSFAEIQQQLSQNLPVCAQIAWAGGGGSHYVVISGYDMSPGGIPLISVSDPMLQDSNVVVWDYDAFVVAYSPSYALFGEGTWVDTCLVKPPKGQ